MPESNSIPSYTVLIVDDSPLSRTFLARTLKEYTVLQAKDGQEAIKLISEQVTCVIMDAKMPGLSGFETSSALWKCFPNLPIIMHTGYTDEHTISEIVTYGFEHYISKGTDETDIRLKVRNACQKYMAVQQKESYEQQLKEQSETLSQALESLGDTQTKLVHSERTVAVSRLISSLSHRLKNPIIAIEVLSPNLIRDIVELLDCIPDLWELGFTKSEWETLFSVARVAFQNALSHRAPTTLEGIKIAAKLKKELEASDIFMEKTLLSAAVKYQLDATQLARLYSLKPKISRVDALHLLKLFVLIGNQLRVGEHCATEISQTIKTVLNTARQEKEIPSKGISINHAIENALDLLSHNFKGVKVELQLGKVPTIDGYPVDLMYCFVYLIENALDALQEEGTIRIKTHLQHQQILAEISDNGKNGIPKALQENIFKAFFTTKKLGSGTGLGLFDGHRIIVEKHQGELLLESVPGKTTFTISIPVNT